MEIKDFLDALHRLEEQTGQKVWGFELCPKHFQDLQRLAREMMHGGDEDFDEITFAGAVVTKNRGGICLLCREERITPNMLKQEGFQLDKDLPYFFKMVGKYEITIENCVGDHCVGVFIDRDLVEPKYRAQSLEEAIEMAKLFEYKYS